MKPRCLNILQIKDILFLHRDRSVKFKHSDVFSMAMFFKPQPYKDL